MNKEKTSKIIAYIVAPLLACAIFMYFMDVLKWKDPVFENVVTPSFFDLIFGANNQNKYVSFPLVSGALVMFILQLIIIVGAIAFFIFKFKKNDKVAYLIVAGIGAFAIISGIHCFCMNFFISNYAFIKGGQFPIGKEVPETYKNLMALNYGAFVYGFTMIIGGLAAFIPYTISYCLKKK